MRARMKEWWDKYESWLAPMTVATFCALGIQVGILIGKNNAQKEFNDQVGALNQVISSQNERIADKDNRLRAMQDLQLNQGKDVIKALSDSTEAAKNSAASAKSSAESAKAVINDPPKANTP